MPTARVEAFSDGVIAIIITIMVLELRPPHDASLAGLRPLLPLLGSYLLSYIFLVFTEHLTTAARCATGEWQGPMGQLAFTVLAFVGSLCDRVDGRE